MSAVPRTCFLSVVCTRFEQSQLVLPIRAYRNEVVRIQSRQEQWLLLSGF